MNKKLTIATLMISFVLLMMSCSGDDSDKSPENSPSGTIVVTTQPIANITRFDAISGGNIMGGTSAAILSKGLVWSASRNPTLNDNYTDEGSGTTSFSSNVNNLDLNTIYYLRAYASTNNETIYGEEVSFITLEHKVFEGEIVFTTQAQIDAFGKEGYSKITIGLIVYESEPGNIISLAPLESLLEVGGIDPVDGFSIQIVENTDLASLHGLHNLTEVKGGIGLSDNPSLISIEQLSNITDMTGDFRLRKLPGISNLKPFQKLRSIGRHLLISQMSLQDLTGLQGITSIGGTLVINNNDNLLNLDGLNSLNSVGEDFKIRENAKLINLNGLSNLQYVGYSLNINHNEVLSDLCGITPLINSNGIQYKYYVSSNAYNPTEQDILNGNCSQ